MKKHRQERATPHKYLKSETEHCILLKTTVQKKIELNAGTEKRFKKLHVLDKWIGSQQISRSLVLLQLPHILLT